MIKERYRTDFNILKYELIRAIEIMDAIEENQTQSRMNTFNVMEDKSHPWWSDRGPYSLDSELKNKLHEIRRDSSRLSRRMMY